MGPSELVVENLEVLPANGRQVLGCALAWEVFAGMLCGTGSLDAKLRPHMPDEERPAQCGGAPWLPFRA